MRTKFTCIAIAVMLVAAMGCFQNDSVAPLNALSALGVYGVNGVPGEYCTTLYAGQDIVAGEVCVEVIDAGATEELCITYKTTGGWQLVETHTWAGTALIDMPQTRKGNPKVGNFPYKSGDITGATTYTVCVPLGDFGGEAALCDIDMIVAAHAALQLVDETGTVIQTETGWGNGDPIVERGNWATYFGVQFTCADVPEGQNSETAFAYNCDDAARTCFIDIPDENINRWGWTNGALGAGTYYFDIYAGAGQCDINKGTLVGLLTVVYDGSTATVTYNTCGNYTMTETHLYVGNEILAWDDNPNDPGFTVAPGKYPSQNTGLANVKSDTHTITGLSGDIYVVAHAVVWGNYDLEGDCGDRGCVPPEVPCAEVANTVYTTELIPDPSTYPAEQNWAIGTMVEAASGGQDNPWCSSTGGAGELCREGGFGVDALDGSREYILDRDGVPFADYRMMAYDLGTAKRGFRLYTAIDHWDGSANAFVNGCCGYSAAFVTADVMEYSVWGYIGPADGAGVATAADLLVNSNWELLSDAIAYDNTNTLTDGHPTYTWDGVTEASGAPVKVYTAGSAQVPGVYHAYSRDYIFCSAYRYIGVRSTTITIGVNDGDPEIDAVFGFDPVQ